MAGCNQASIDQSQLAVRSMLAIRIGNVLALRADQQKRQNSETPQCLLLWECPSKLTLLLRGSLNMSWDSYRRGCPHPPVTLFYLSHC